MFRFRGRDDSQCFRVIVTGYGDFGETWREALGRPNPSGLLARALANGDPQDRSIVVEHRHLAVTHAAVEQFLSEVRCDPPNVILSLGVAPHAQIEEAPENWKREAIDGAGGRIEAGPIRMSRPPRERLCTLLPVTAIERALGEAAADGRLSHRTIGSSAQIAYAPDGSGYLCNYLNYRLTETFGAEAGVMAGFVHVSEATTVVELQIVLRAIVQHWMQAEPRIREAG